jgi:tetratricopeptide (TPR) repeat protein
MRRAVELDPGAAAAQSNLAGALEGLGRDAEALEAFGKAVELDPGYAKPYYHLGLLYEKAGRTAEAAKAYKRFLERWDGDPRVAAQVRQQRERLEGGR